MNDVNECENNIEEKEKLKCTNKQCGVNKQETCTACDGNKIDLRCHVCKNCNGAGITQWDQDFILVTQEMTMWDFELDEDGEVGDNITSREDEDNHATARIVEIRCRYCNEVVDIPKSWIDKIKRFQCTNDEFDANCRGNTNIRIVSNITEELKN